jgi:hypothetical protein
MLTRVALVAGFIAAPIGISAEEAFECPSSQEALQLVDVARKSPEGVDSAIKLLIDRYGKPASQVRTSNDRVTLTWTRRQSDKAPDSMIRLTLSLDGANPYVCVSAIVQ